MEHSRNISRVSWASGSNLRQVNFLSSPSSDDECDQSPPGFGRNHFKNQSESCDDIPLTPVIKWKCPPSFALVGERKVVAGESSDEKELQKQRETRVKEFVYHPFYPFLENPLIDKSVEEECYDRTLVLVVPLKAVEEEVVVPVEAVEEQEAVPMDLEEDEVVVPMEVVEEQAVVPMDLEEEELEEGEIEEGEYVPETHAVAKEVWSTTVETMKDGKYSKNKNPIITKRDETREWGYSTVGKYENNFRDSKWGRFERNTERRDEVKFKSHKLCRYFNSSNSCRHGDNCYFRHERRDISRGGSKRVARDDKVFRL